MIRFSTKAICLLTLLFISPVDRLHAQDFLGKSAVDIDSLYWENPFGIPGANGSVVAMVIGADSCLYVGGYFTEIGDTLANYVAKYDGQKWVPLGIGLDAGVLTLAADDSGNVYAGGWFTQTGNGGSLGLNGRVAKWDGANWSAMGDGFTHDPQRLRFNSFDNQLYEVGGLTVSWAGQPSVNRWNSGTQSWDSLAPPGPGVADIAFDSFGLVYIGGSFTSIGDSLVSGIAAQGSTGWGSVGTGVSGPVYALEMGAGDSLWVGGNFSSAGGVITADLALWAGFAFGGWHKAEITSDPFSTKVTALHTGVDGTLWAGGEFSPTDDISGSMWGNIARRTGPTTWTRNEVGTDSGVLDLVVMPDTTLFFGGYFGRALGADQSPIVGARYIGSFDGVKPHNIVPRSFLNVLSIAGDSTGGFFVGGDFHPGTGSEFNRVAHWDGSSWSALGSGLDSTVTAVMVSPNGTVYVGGSFSNAGGTPANYIASWNGSAWSALGTGANAPVLSLTMGNADTLYAGGNFTTIGGVSAKGVAGWDGSSWFALGAGIPGYDNTEDLVYHPDGRLFAGRYFFGIDSGVFEWDGTTWTELGTAVSGRALAIDSTGLLIAGSLWWNGSSWTDLEPGIDFAMYDLMIDSSGVLYAALDNYVWFSSTACYDSEVEFNGVAMFDGSCWHPLGSGTSLAPRALGAGSVVVGGSFTHAGGNDPHSLPSGLAIWKAPASFTTFRVKARVFLEGPYNAGVMDKSLNTAGYLESSALAHPYSDSPWNFGGSDSVATGFYGVAGVDIVDWVYLKLYEGDPGSSLVTVDSAVGFVSTLGHVMSAAGPSVPSLDSTVTFSNVPPGNYHLAIYHRNHLAAVSAVTISFGTASTTAEYSFTGSMASAHGSSPMKDLGDGNYALFAGDANVDGQTTASDFNLWLVDTKAVATGYLSPDFDMDGQVTASDFNIWLVNTKAVARAQVGF